MSVFRATVVIMLLPLNLAAALVAFVFAPITVILGLIERPGAVIDFLLGEL